MIATAIGIIWYFASGSAAIAQPAAIQVIQQHVEITVFNEIETERATLFSPTSALSGRWPGRHRDGMILVKDHRIVMNLREGDNWVRFTDVAATIDPTSVRFVSETDPWDTVVVEQNYEFDLASADALLKRYIDKQITCVPKDNAHGDIAGYLCSYDNANLVLADAPPREDGGDRKTQTVARATLQAIRMADMPKDLYTKPTLI